MIFRVLILVLCALAFSCQGSPIARDLPALWPQPPNPDGEVFMLLEEAVLPPGTVCMSRSFWDLLSDYVFTVEAMRARAQGTLETAYQ